MKRLKYLIILFISLFVLSSCDEEVTQDHLPDYCRTYSGFTSVMSSDMYVFINEKLNYLGQDPLSRDTYLNAIDSIYQLELEYDFSDPDLEENYANLSGLQCFQNLNDLTLSGSAFKDISAISELKNIEKIKLEDTRVISIKSFLNLSKVYSLELVNNQTLQSTDGIGEMLKLEILDLSNNGLTDISQLTNLVNLRVLILDNNQLDANGLSGIKSLVSLETLSAKNNNIQNIDELTTSSPTTEFVNLSSLDLSGNDISSIGSGSLVGLNALDSLNLSKNPLPVALNLSGLSGSSISELTINETNVETITGIGIPSLATLNISDNKITDLSSIITSLTIGGDNHTLTSLIANKNNINSVDTFNQLKGLRGLDLSENNLDDVAFATIASSDTITSLDLSKNSITSIPATLVSGMPFLVSLTLRENNITDTSNIEGHPSLLTLDLSDNGLTNIKGFKSLSDFQNLILYNHNPDSDTIPNENLIDTIEDSFNSTPDFVFDLKNTPDVDAAAYTIKYGANLKILGESFVDGLNGIDSSYSALDFSFTPTTMPNPSGSGTMDPIDGYTGDVTFDIKIIEISRESFKGSTINAISFNGQGAIDVIDSDGSTNLGNTLHFLEGLSDLNTLYLAETVITDFSAIDGNYENDSDGESNPIIDDLGTSLSTFVYVGVTPIPTLTGFNHLTALSTFYFNVQGNNILNYNNAFNDIEIPNTTITGLGDSITLSNVGGSNATIVDSFNNVSVGTTSDPTLALDFSGMFLTNITRSFNNLLHFDTVDFTSVNNGNPSTLAIEDSFNDLYTDYTDLTATSSLGFNNMNIASITGSFKGSYINDLYITGNTALTVFTDVFTASATNPKTTINNELNLSGNGLNDASLSVIDVTSAVSLNLSNNNITNTSSLPSVDGITGLDISNNNISIINNLYNSHATLGSVSLGGNPISSITNSLNDVTGLTTVDISGIAELTAINDSFKNLTLNDFNLSNSGTNSSITIDATAFSSTSFGSATFDITSPVFQLNISGASLTNYNFLNQFNTASLKSLDASNLSLVDGDISTFTTAYGSTLEVFNISDNSITDISLFNSYSSLLVLIANANPITTINNYTNSNITHLGLSTSSINNITDSFNNHDLSSFNFLNDSTTVVPFAADFLSAFNGTISINNSFSHDSITTLDIADGINYTIDDTSFDFVEDLTIRGANPVDYGFIANLDRVATLSITEDMTIDNLQCNTGNTLTSFVARDNQTISNSFNSCSTSFNVTLANGITINSSFNGSATYTIDTTGITLNNVTFDDSFKTMTTLDLSDSIEITNVSFNNNSFNLVTTLFMNDITSSGIDINITSALNALNNVSIDGSNVSNIGDLNGLPSLVTLSVTNSPGFTANNQFNTLGLINIDFSDSTIDFTNSFNNTTYTNINLSSVTITTLSNSFDNIATTTLNITNINGGAIDNSFDSLNQVLDISTVTSDITGSFNSLNSNLTIGGYATNSTITNSFNGIDNISKVTLNTNLINYVSSFNNASLTQNVTFTNVAVFTNSFNNVTTVTFPTGVSAGLDITSGFNSLTTLNLSGSNMSDYAFIDNIGGSLTNLNMQSTASSSVHTITSLYTINTVDFTNSTFTTLTGFLNNPVACTITNLNLTNVPLESITNSFNNCNSLANLNGSTYTITATSLDIINSFNGSTASSTIVLGLTGTDNTIDGSFKNTSINTLTITPTNYSSITNSFDNLDLTTPFELVGYTNLTTLNGFSGAEVRVIDYNTLGTLDTSVLGTIGQSYIEEIYIDGDSNLSNSSNTQFNAMTNLNKLYLLNDSDLSDLDFIDTPALDILTDFRINTIHTTDYNNFNKLCTSSMVANSARVNTTAANIVLLTANGSCNQLHSDSGTTGIYYIQGLIDITFDGTSISSTTTNTLEYNSTPVAIEYTITNPDTATHNYLTTSVTDLGGQLSFSSGDGVFPRTGATLTMSDLINDVVITFSNNSTEFNTFTYTIDIVDTEAPVISGSSTINLFTSGAATHNYNRSATDNFDGPVTPTYQYFNSDCSSQTTISDLDSLRLQTNAGFDACIVVTATDTAGNSDTLTINISVTDDTPPTWDSNNGSPATINDSQTTWTAPVLTASDNVEGNNQATTLTYYEFNGSCTSTVINPSNLGTDYISKARSFCIEYTYSDGNGLTPSPASTKYKITVTDTVNPVISISPTSFYTWFESNDYQPSTMFNITVTDNQYRTIDGSEVNITYYDSTNSSTVGNEEAARTYLRNGNDLYVRFNISDDQGNSATQVVQMLTHDDDIDPVISAPATVNCNVSLSATCSLGTATATDTNHGDISGSIVTTYYKADGTTNLGTLANARIDLGNGLNVIIKYNVTDASGNFATLVQTTVNAIDDVEPTIATGGNTTCNISVYNSCTLDSATANDGVDGDISGSIVRTYFKADSTTPLVDENAARAELQKGLNIVIKFNVDDAAYNSAFEQQITVTADDDTNPVITKTGQPTTFVAGSTEPDWTTYWTITDNATSVTVTVGMITESADMTTVGTFDVTISYTDGEGNSSSDTITITITAA